MIARLDQAPCLEADLHFLKGSALNLGFTAFSMLCQDGERKSAKGRASEVALAPILDCYEDSKKVFMVRLAEEPIS